MLTAAAIIIIVHHHISIDFFCGQIRKMQGDY